MKNLPFNTAVYAILAAVFPRLSRDRVGHRRVKNSTDRSGSGVCRHGRIDGGLAGKLAAACLLGASAIPAQALGAGFQPLESIRDTVQRYLTEQTAGQLNPPTIEVGRIDGRLRLAACGSPLEASLGPGSGLSGRTTVEVRCSGPKPWNLYVQASIRVFEQVLVASRPLTRGRLVSRSDLEYVERDVGRLTAGYFTRMEDVIGMRVKRAVGSGMVLNGYILEQKKVVRRGERVTIIADAGGIQVRMAGKALKDGSKGDLIPVQNLSSKREVEATVAGPGLVEVHM